MPAFAYQALDDTGKTQRGVLQGDTARSVRGTLREYHAARGRPRTDAAKLLDASGFLGGGEGPADLSTRYKSYLIDALEEKIPLRVSEPKPDDPRR